MDLWENIILGIPAYPLHDSYTISRCYRRLYDSFDMGNLVVFLQRAESNILVP